GPQGASRVEPPIPPGNARERSPVESKLAFVLVGTYAGSSRDGNRVAFPVFAERRGHDPVCLQFDLVAGDGLRIWASLAGRPAGMGRGSCAVAGLRHSDGAAETGATRLLSRHGAGGMGLG